MEGSCILLRDVVEGVMPAGRKLVFSRFRGALACDHPVPVTLASEPHVVAHGLASCRGRRLHRKPLFPSSGLENNWLAQAGPPKRLRGPPLAQGWSWTGRVSRKIAKWGGPAQTPQDCGATSAGGLRINIMNEILTMQADGGRLTGGADSRCGKFIEGWSKRRARR